MQDDYILTCLFCGLQVSTIITLPGSPFKAKWAQLQNLFSQAGLIEKWLDLRPPWRHSRRARPLSMKHILPALFVLGVGCFMGLLLFVTEVTSRAWAKTVLKRVLKWNILRKQNKKMVNILNHDTRPTLWTRGQDKYFL